MFRTLILIAVLLLAAVLYREPAKPAPKPVRHVPQPVSPWRDTLYWLRMRVYQK